MKRIFIPLTALALAVTTMLSGCSCVATTPLTFNNNFYGGTNAVPSVNYSETLVYNVEHIDSYSDAFEISPQLTKDIIEFDISGTYTTTFTVLDKSDVTEKFTSDILSSYTGNVVYRIESELNLQSHYKANYGIYKEDENATAEKEKTFEDEIKTDVYFLESGHSFAPIWSNSNTKSSYLSVDGDMQASIYVLEYSQTIAYNKDDYTITTVSEGSDIEPNECDYTFKTVIDNNSLLFALRNIDIEHEKTHSLPTVHATYGDAQTLTITNQEERTINNFKLKVNGAEQTENISVKEYTFIRGSSNNTGLAQHVVIQKSKTTNLPFKAYILEHISPLTTYGNFLGMGGLKYTLSEIK
jgi:hypothetical protein